MIQDIEQQLGRYIAEAFLYADPSTPIDPDTSLLEAEILDSTGVLQLVMHLESAYGVTVEAEEITPDNFDSIARLAAFIRHKRSVGAEAGP